MKKRIKDIVLIGLCLILYSGDLFSQEMRVMSYNIKFDDTRDSVNNWNNRKDWLIGLLKYHEPDIIGTQEGLKHQLDDMLEGLPDFKMVGVGRDDGKEKGEYSAILYNAVKYTLVDQGTFWLSDSPEKVSVGWDAALPRVCTWALLETREGNRFYVYNTHFDHVGEKARAESARLISTHVRNSVKAPTVILGDFNVTPDTAPYGVLSEHFQDARQESLTEPYGPEATFNAFRFEEQPERRIDYIFLYGKWEVLSFATLSDSKEMRYPSDHFPVVADLTPIFE
jgi:endonuclease/exonuclease/phosphatase family metal-dependent hydrolase